VTKQKKKKKSSIRRGKNKNVATGTLKKGRRQDQLIVGKRKKKIKFRWKQERPQKNNSPSQGKPAHAKNKTPSPWSGHPEKPLRVRTKKAQGVSMTVTLERGHVGTSRAERTNKK